MAILQIKLVKEGNYNINHQKSNNNNNFRIIKIKEKFNKSNKFIKTITKRAIN